jgi:signal recognition particle receptor subunit beta
LEARRDMVKNLTALGLRPERTPVVLQCNKQDLPSATPASLLQQQLNMESLPAFGACALEGQGIFNTLKTIINAVVARAQREL